MSFCLFFPLEGCEAFCPSVSWWLIGGLGWRFRFLGSPYERDCCLGGIPRIPNHQHPPTQPQQVPLTVVDSSSHPLPSQVIHPSRTHGWSQVEGLSISFATGASRAAAASRCTPGQRGRKRLWCGRSVPWWRTTWSTRTFLAEKSYSNTARGHLQCGKVTGSTGKRCKMPTGLSCQLNHLKVVRQLQRVMTFQKEEVTMILQPFELQLWRVETKWGPWLN